MFGAQLTSLTLDLSKNSIGTEGAQALGAGLAQLAQLTSLTLDLAQNSLGIIGAQALGNRLGRSGGLGLRLRGLPHDVVHNDVLVFFAVHDVADRIADGRDCVHLFFDKNNEE